MSFLAVPGSNHIGLPAAVRPLAILRSEACQPSVSKPFTLSSEVLFPARNSADGQLAEATSTDVCLMYRGLIHDESSCERPY